MRKLFMFVVLFIGCLSFIPVKSQQAVILTENLQPGVYLTFEEFQKNRPSITENFRPDYKDDYYGCPPRYIEVMDHNGVYQLMEKGFWGYSDSTGVYIFGKVLGKSKGFTKIDQFGRYCVFEVLGKVDRRHDVAYTYGNEGLAINIGNRDVDFILDIESGMIVKATKKSIKEILMGDEVLYQKFIKKLDKRDVYLIMEQYNKRHPIEYPLTDD